MDLLGKIASVFSSFDRWTLVQAAVHFVGAPVFVERVARVFLLRTHTNISEADVRVLSQRLGRALMALNLVQGATRTLALPAHQDVWSMWTTTSLGQYYMLGTVFFYIFDCVLLSMQKAPNYDLWIHHIAAVGLFGYSIANKVSEMGSMLILFSELLVPWGFLLFYFKLNKLQAHSFFKTIAYGGVTTLAMRICIWLILLQRLYIGEYHHAPKFLLVSGITFAIAGIGLDVHWMRLYLSNFPAHKRAIAALDGKPAVGFWEAVTTKQKK